MENGDSLFCREPPAILVGAPGGELPLLLFLFPKSWFGVRGWLGELELSR